MGFTFRVLGELRVFDGRAAVPITAGRQEVVIAALLLESGRLLSSDHLVRLLWGEEPPDTARTQIQICVSRLRKALAGAGIDAAIVTRPTGYVLQIGDTALDLHTFRKEVAEARTLVGEGRAAEAADRLRAAVGMWQGPCLNGIPSEALMRVAQRIDEERLAATETFIDLELGLGRHHQLTAEVGRLVDDNPLRERFRGQLMLALYRSGRQAEALEVYRRGRLLLQEELGLEPGQDLRRLEQAILTDEPSLRLPTSAGTASAPPAPPRPDDAADPAETSSTSATPRQLPVDTADFVGHDSLIADAESVLTDASRRRALGIVVVSGRPGVGKSTFANRIAHRLSETHFPDGQLFCRLRGGRADPVSSREVLGRFLRALGLPGPAIPESLEERAEVYRTLLATRRILVVLDDAASEEQILPLLPGNSSCGVLVTSRARLTALPGAHRVPLDILEQQQSLELLENVIGQGRVRGELEAAKALVRAVGGLPLALRIVAARLAARPHWTLASMVQRLADERRRLDELAHGEMTVRASLSLTYDGLTQEGRKLLRLLSLAKGSTFPSWMGGALLDDPHPFPSDLMEQLVDVQMLDVAGIESAGELRYGFHDIVRLFARDRLDAESDGTERRSALRRMGGAWLSLVTRAHRGHFGHDALTGSAPRWNVPESHALALLAEPMDWIESERENLSLVVEDLAQQGEDEYAWEIAVNLAPFYEARGYLDHWARTHRKALTAVRRAGNARGQAALLFSLGVLHINRRQLPEARRSLTSALEIFEAQADSTGRGMCRRNLGLIEKLVGRDEEAMKYFDQACQDFDATGQAWRRASVLVLRAGILLQRDDLEQAEADLREVLAIWTETVSKTGRARALWQMGHLHLRRGKVADALRVFEDVLRVVTGDGDVIGEGHLLHDLGRVHARMDQSAEASSFFERAITVREHILDQPGAASVRVDLADLLLRDGRTAQAEVLLGHAVDVLRTAGMAAESERAERLLARTVVGARMEPVAGH
ncbi:AfsR/SARP family transcriptional regulator [Streptomyces sp. NPDC004457]|uniref:AfsR/SARP family transcriptional regulator n=1 Tax=Streptomyces spinosus TaxID=2872623 RepID=UPI001CEDFA67|nr:BTAD domain-containing putative transcriptional regulator [Streptomyces spinosus]